MSPWMCSHSGLSDRLSSSISGDRSVSVSVACAFMCEALFPPAAAEFQDRPGGSPSASVNSDERLRRLVAVVVRRGQQMEPGRELGIERGLCGFVHDGPFSSNRGASSNKRCMISWRGQRLPSLRQLLLPRTATPIPVAGSKKATVATP